MKRFSQAAGLILLAALVAGGPCTAMAQEPPPDPPERPRFGPPGRPPGPPPLDRILERHADRLRLDEQTRTKIREIAASSKQEAEEIHERLAARHDEMRQLLRQDTPDEEAVMRQAERIGEVETEMQKHRLRTMLRIRGLLTPEQRRELVEIHEGMKKRFRDDRPRRPRPPGGGAQSPPPP